MRVAVALLSCAAAAAAAGIEEYLRAEMELNRIPGLAVAVVREDAVVALAAYGVRDLAGGEPMMAGTLVELASVSKSFTGLAVAELSRSGALQLDEPVTRYLPEFQIGGGPRPAHIRVQDLLRHTSGLSRHDDFLVPCCGRPGEGDLGLAVRRLRRARLRREPGAGFAYAHSNYVLLAALVERVSGEPFPAYMRKHVFGPLGMNRTTLDESEARAWGKAEAHEMRWGRMRPGGSRFSGWYGASQVKSTAGDMARYVQALLGPWGDVWREALRAGTRYHWGWFVEPEAGWLGGEPAVEHGGDIWGGNAAVALAPQAGVGVVVLLNAGVGRAQPIARGVLLRVLGREAPAAARQSWSGQTDNWAMVLAGASLMILVGVGVFVKRLLTELRRGERRLGWDAGAWEKARVVGLLLMAVYLAGLLASDAMPPLPALPASLRVALPLLAVSVALLLAAVALGGWRQTRGRR